MNTRFGILAGLALVIFIGLFTAMLALGAISPLGVQGTDHPIDDNGQAVDFQSTMVADFMVDNTVKRPGDVSGYRFTFTTAEDLVANQDTITVHFDKDFKGHGTNLSRNHVTVSASHAIDATTGDNANIMQTGAYIPNTDATLDRLGTAHPVHHLQASPMPLTNSAVLNNIEYSIPVPDMNGAEDGVPGIAAGATVALVISPAAGITNATEAGNKGPLGVYTSKQLYLVYSTVTVVLYIALSDYGSNRNKSLTVIGKGFQNGTTATVYLANANGNRVALVYVTAANDDTFQAVFTVTVPPFVPGKGNFIYAEDGNEPPFTAGPVGFDLEGLLTVSPASAAVGDEVDITLEDWPNGPIPAGAVTIAGVTQRIIGSPSVSGNSASFGIEIGTDTPPGANEIRVTANGESDHKKITIFGAILEASPATAVPNQAITVTGQGFARHATINAAGDGSMVSIGRDQYALSGSAGGFRNFNNGQAVTVDSGGSWSATIIVPITRVTTTAWVHALTVKDSGDHEGTVGITIPPRTLTIDPAEARPGETVTLSGSGFPATNTRAKEQNTPSIQVYYDNDLVGTSIPDRDGNIMLSFRVPLDATISSTNRVEARYMIPGAPSGAAPVEVSVNHEVPGARIKLSMDEGKPGDSLTVTGDGFRASALVEYVRIDGIEVTPAPRPATDRNGEFTATILVPNLTKGTYSVEVQVGGITASANFKVLDFLGAGSVAGDRAALVALYNATAGEKWRKNSGWLTDAPLSQWYGVETDSTGRVAGLYLELNQLSGEIPEELGDLTNLYELHLDDNQLTGEIPAELGDLTNLRTLGLGGNQLSGCVPATLRSAANNDLAELGLPFCDMLNGRSVVVISSGSEKLAVARHCDFRIVRHPIRPSAAVVLGPPQPSTASCSATSGLP